jgi:DNA-binding FadR family transcriptional regulator
VSRPTIREALRILEVESLITLGRGARAGATVLGPTVERAAEYAAMVLSSAGTTIGELHGARTLIEPSMVMQLAKKKDRKLLDELQAYAQAGLEAISKSDHVEANACMAKFHAALVRASDNRALILIVEMLTVLQRQTLDLATETAAGEHASLRAQQPKALQSYLQLVELMRQGKAEEAQTFWRKYMERMHAFLEKSGLQARRIRHS